ncbi:MAG: branched-chain amino acid ABC transporter substrate-binding protein [Thermoprotei archaeon]|nr:MAG: branched-chain amino acid ABC transporter substrate-binding protein [Thermoprotei archaeon]
MSALTKNALVMLIIGLLVGSLIGFTFTSFLSGAAQTGVTQQQEIIEVPIGALLPLEGPLSSFAKRNQIALEMAIEDINAFAENTGSKFRFKLLVEDTKLDKQVALSRLQSLAAQGVLIAIGPMASSEVGAIKSFADNNKIIVISQSSTAPSLGIPNDYIFRLVPTDLLQSKAIARLIMDRGYTKAAVIYRGDDWGVGLFEAFKERFEELGGQVEGVFYDPNAKDLSGEVRKLSDIASKFGDNTAVLMIAFEDDGMQIIKLAAQDPVLSKLEWFGTDGTAVSGKLKDQVGAEVVKLGGLLSTNFQPAKNPLQEEFMKRFKARAGENPDAYSMNAYDAAWIAALSVMLVGEYNSEKVVQVLPDVAKRYFGVSGNTILNENGDRASGDYAIWKLVQTDKGLEWKIVAMYSVATDSVTYLGEE